MRLESFVLVNGDISAHLGAADFRFLPRLKKNPFDFFFFFLLTLGNGLTIPRNCCSIGKNKSHKLSGNEHGGTKRKRKDSLRLKRPSLKNNIFVQSRRNSEKKLLRDIYRGKDGVTL